MVLISIVTDEEIIVAKEDFLIKEEVHVIFHAEHCDCTGRWQNLDVFLIRVLTEDPPAPSSPPSSVAPWAEMVMMWALFQWHMAYSCLYKVTCQARQTETQGQCVRGQVQPHDSPYFMSLSSCIFPS